MSKDFPEKIRVRDHLVSQEIFDLIFNKDLEMYITSPKPSVNDLPKFYESENYISHTDASDSLIDKIYQAAKSFMLTRKINLLKSYKKKGSLLDIGAGTGDFLHQAKKSGFDVCGVEPNASARKKAKEKDVDVFANHIEITQKFDIITMWHVLEHVHNIEEQIHWLKKFLSDDGILIIAVPNFKSYDAGVYKINWAAYDVPRHLYHFSKKSISKLFSTVNFEVVDIKPLYLDSFYVSLLSENIKGSKFSIPKAFINGLLSNVFGLFTKEYSSHIYILKNKPI